MHAQTQASISLQQPRRFWSGCHRNELSKPQICPPELETERQLQKKRIHRQDRTFPRQSRPFKVVTIYRFYSNVSERTGKRYLKGPSWYLRATNNHFNKPEYHDYLASDVWGSPPAARLASVTHTHTHQKQAPASKPVPTDSKRFGERVETAGSPEDPLRGLLPRH